MPLLFQTECFRICCLTQRKLTYSHQKQGKPGLNRITEDNAPISEGFQHKAIEMIPGCRKHGGILMNLNKHGAYIHVVICLFKNCQTLIEIIKTIVFDVIYLHPTWEMYLTFAFA